MSQDTQALLEHFTRLQDTFFNQKTKPLSWRLKQLSRMEEMLNTHVEALQAALLADLGKQATEAWNTEIGFLLKELRHTKKKIKKWMRVRHVSSPVAIQPAKSYLQPEPLGVVAIFGAWNYPVQLTLSPVIAAIAAGNAVCLKPSEVAPQTSALIVKLCTEYLDEEAIWAVEGDATTAAHLLNLPFNHFFYTGGGQIGKKVMRAAADHLASVTLELGGKSPVIVSQQCDLAKTAKRIVWGKFMNAGQTCIAPDYVLVESSVVAQFQSALTAAIENFYGKKVATSNDYGRIVSNRHLNRLTALLQDEKLAESQIWGGEIDDESRFLAPTLIFNCPADADVMDDEIFGPILPILTVQDMDEALAFVQARPQPLACYLFSNDTREQRRVEQRIRCGSLCINDTMVFMLNAELPFGGVGPSGMGRYHGKWGFDTFSHLKPVVKRSFMFDVDLRYPPYTDFKQKLLKKLLG